MPSNQREPKISQTSKKLKTHSTYSLTNTSPFPTHPLPTSAEAHLVLNLLTNSQLSCTNTKFPARTPSSSVVRNAASTCGNVQNVLAAVIGTVLAQHTSSRNAAHAQAALDTAFGHLNFKAIATAPISTLEDILRPSGLARIKSRRLQDVLVAVNARHGSYSLQHLADENVHRTNAEISSELLALPGVGPKSAACVLLFSLGRTAFAVDTHVFRISTALGWLPVGTNRVLAQAHLEARVPDELKYALHMAMVKHGKCCKGCKVVRKLEIGCVLREFVEGRRTRS